jgi:hypothetical protein
VSVPEWFLFLYFKYWYFRSLKRFWDCDFNFVNVLLTFVRLSGTSENWRRTSRSCITVVRRDKWKNQIPKRADTTDKSISTGLKYWVCCIIIWEINDNVHTESGYVHVLIKELWPIRITIVMSLTFTSVQQYYACNTHGRILYLFIF